MKLPKLTLAALLAIGLAPTYAATLNFDNSDFGFTGNDLLLLDNAGNPLSSGFVALSTTPDTSGLLSDSLTVLGPGNYPGLGLFSGSFNTVNDGGLTGVNLFIVFGNNANPALADQFGSINTMLSFTKADTPPPPSSLDFIANPSSMVTLGTGAPITIDATSFGGPASYNTFGLRAVPEPSSTLLFGLAGLALLIRRRR
jgi:hypothetical protein